MTPALTTDRLTLRRPQADDLAAYGAYCASDRTRFVGGPFTAAQARAKLEAMITQWDHHGYGRFMILRDGHPIGHAGILHGTPPEITWTLYDAQAEGQGIAAEAARAALDWAATRWPGRVLESHVHPDNAPSQHLAKRLGGVADPRPVWIDETPFLRFLHRLPLPIAPVLSTERLRLRPQTMADVRALMALFATDRARFMGGPLKSEDAWRLLMAEVALWPLTSRGPWAIDRLSDGAFLGQVSVAQLPNFPEMELGWTLLAPHEGQGYAQEAARAARDWARAQGEPALVSYIDPENARSIALAKRLGAELDAGAPGPDPEDLVFRHWGAA